MKFQRMKDYLDKWKPNKWDKMGKWNSAVK